MSETQHSTVSIRSSEKLEDTFMRMNINEDNTSLYPDRPGERNCQFFLRTGVCGFGNTCRFNHPFTPPQQTVIYHKEDLPERIGEPDCDYFLKTGACKFGPTCKYHHPKDRNGAKPVLFNVLGYPMRRGEKSCAYYMQTGTCSFGVACKFHHPHPQTQPQPSLNGHSSFGMPRFPSVGYPYASGLTMMSAYGAMSQLQTYMPFMVSPPQGLLPPQSWATYMAASRPYSSTSAPVPIAVTSHHHPASSEIPECRAFMYTGACKYGDDCKYIHPKDRMLQSSPNLAIMGHGNSNGNKPIAEVQSSEKQDKPEVQDLSPPSLADTTVLFNSIPSSDNPNSVSKKQDDTHAELNNSEVKDLKNAS